MADNIFIEPDRFSDTLEGMLTKVGSDVEGELPDAIRGGLRRGANEWRRRARELFNGERSRKRGIFAASGGHRYKKHGVWHEAGKYSRSIRSHMLRPDGSKPTGEIGSPKLPGLPHLLELGHAKVGGGRVQGFEHIAPSADIAFETTYVLVEEAVDRALKS